MSKLQDKIEILSLLDRNCGSGWVENHAITEYEVVFDKKSDNVFLIRVYTGLGKFAKINNAGRRVVKFCCVHMQTENEFKYIEFDLDREGKKLGKAFLICLETILKMRRCKICNSGWMIPKNGKNGKFLICTNHGESCSNRVNVSLSIGQLIVGGA